MNGSGAGNDLRLIVHPAFEFRRQFVLVSFTERTIKDRQVVDQTIRVVRGLGEESELIETLKDPSPVVRIGTCDYVVDTRFQSPPFLDDQWSRADVEEFLGTGQAPVGHQLYEELLEAIQRHVDLAERGAYVILAVFPALTFTYPAFAAVPFPLLLGPKDTGKSQTLDVLRQLCRCGDKSRPTGASLGDKIESQRVTWLVDQANRLTEELIEILVDSYRAGAARTVTDVEHRGRPFRFETFGPKAFAAHRDFDPDLRDRCIQITMAPATRRVEPLLAEDQRLQQLRWQLYRFTLRNFHKLYRTRAYQNREEVGRILGFQDRELELWWPFEVLMEWMDVPEEDREAARAFYRASLPSTKAELDEGTKELLSALRSLSNGSKDDFPVRSDELVRKLSNIIDGEWTESRIGSRLKDHGLVASKNRPYVNGKRVTAWVINAELLRHQLKAWNLQGIDPEAAP